MTPAGPQSQSITCNGIHNVFACWKGKSYNKTWTDVTHTASHAGPLHCMMLELLQNTLL